MSLSPINILQRLLELKLQQQNRNSPSKLCENSNNSINASAYQTIAGLSAFDSTIIDENTPKKQQNWESQRIRSPQKSFNELIEEKLAEDNGSVVEIVNVKPKRPFLRKGAGLERFRMSPVQINRQNKRPITPLRAPDVAVQAKSDWIEPEQMDPIPKINEMVKVGPSEQSLYEKQLEKELKIFEELEERANNSSFCSTNSSVLRILSSTPSKPKEKPIQTIIEEKRHVQWEDDEIESHLDKKDIEEILQKLHNMADNNKNGENNWSSSSSSCSNTSICSNDVEINEKNEAITPSKCLNCEKLEEKLIEYEERFKKEREIVAELRKSYEDKHDSLNRDFRRKLKELHDEQDNFHIEMEQERKKLAKEKQTYQNLIKEAQNKTNRREREQISNLKQEVEDLKETLKLKESKNGMTQARLRNQIKQFEKETSNLKDEIAKLTKENAKLVAMKKVNRKPVESSNKVLKENNKKDKIAREECNNSENNEDSLLEMTKFHSLNYLDVEKQYESVFNKGEFKQNSSISDSKKTDRSERILEDGSKEIKYNNGNIKTISADGNTTQMKYFNGDIKQTFLLDGIVKYFYFDKNIWQTTFTDGSELIEFPEGSKEKRYKDGKCEIILPDNVIQTLYPDGNQEIKYTDGSTLNIKSNGDKILELPNGQKEIETKEHKRREYPDGTVKILYPDGTQETRFANGRIRIRDNSGKLVMDTHS